MKRPKNLARAERHASQVVEWQGRLADASAADESAMRPHTKASRGLAVGFPLGRSSERFSALVQKSERRTQRRRAAGFDVLSVADDHAVEIPSQNVIE
jgi:hypothetical protein